MTITIYHNAACGTSRNVLGLIRNSGEEPAVIEYLKTPPARAELLSLLARMGMTPRQILRQKGTPYAELGLGDPSLSDDALLDAIEAHPILIERPIVVTPLGAIAPSFPALVAGAASVERARASVCVQPPRRVKSGGELGSQGASYTLELEARLSVVEGGDAAA